MDDPPGNVPAGQGGRGAQPGDGHVRGEGPRPENLTAEQEPRLAQLLKYNRCSVRAYLLKDDFQSFREAPRYFEWGGPTSSGLRAGLSNDPVFVDQQIRDVEHRRSHRCKAERISGIDEAYTP